MQICMNIMDWNQARAFCATAQHGTLSAAARELNLTQPTLSRQVAALEQSLNVSLFERVGKRLVLTEQGAALLPLARKMSDAAQEMTLIAAGQSSSMEGIVTISAADSVATHLLPSIFKEMRHQAPSISIEIIVTNSLSDLLRREADIAIRHIRPETDELIAQLLGYGYGGFYASLDWLSHNPEPVYPKDLANLAFIGFDKMMHFNAYLEEMGISVQKRDVHFFCDNTIVTHELVAQGLGIGVLMTLVADKCPQIRRVLTGVPPIEFPFWLATHRELNTNKKIRFVKDFLAKAIHKQLKNQPSH